MAKEITVDVDKFKLGLYALEDTSKAPIGSARIMTNMQITDRGGIAPRPGTTILGASNSSSSGIRGFYNFRKSFDADEFLIKCYDDEMEAYSKVHSPSAASAWYRIKDGFTSGKEFGFVTSLTSVENEDYAIFCNRYEDFQRYSGATTLLNGALSGAETAVTVDSVLTDEIFYSGTATGSSATTLTVSSAPWATGKWINLYVYITSGAQSGKIRKITATSTTVITFDTLGSDPGSCTFQIRKAAFPATGTLIYGGTTIAYTAIPTATTFTVSSAHAAADNTVVTLSPTVYPENPRGNRFTNYLGRIAVGQVRSALALDSGGATQGYSMGGSYFFSKPGNHVNFTYSNPRVAGEAQIISTPYGGGEVTDVCAHEDAVYLFKPRYIEATKFSQDTNDLANTEPLKAETGSIGRVIKGSNDVYFITADNKLTSLGRVRAKDTKPQSENIGIKIKRLLDNYVFTTGFGLEHKDRLYIPAKSSSSVTNNDILIIYNRNNDAFEGIWNIGAFGLQQFNGMLMYAESNGANVYQMLTGHADVNGTDRFPIVSEYATNYMNLTASKANLQAMNSLFFEGYIKGGSAITFKAWKDFALNPFLSFDFAGTESRFLDGQVLNAYLGGESIALAPMGSISEADAEGRRHFSFRVYFPFQYGNYFSVGFESSGADLDYEVTRLGLGVKESVSVDTNRVKSV